MTRAAGPRWTAEPSRVAGLSRGAALALLAGVGAAVAAAGLAGGGEPGGDPTLYAGAVEAVRHGADFHEALGQELRNGGEAAGRLAFPPPTLAIVLAPLPDWAASAIVAVLAGAVFLAWQPVIGRAFAQGAARVAGLGLLGLGLAPYLQPSLVQAPELWAGLLLALSLGQWARGGWVEAAAFGLAAALVREVAGLYLLVMLVFALLDGARREALGWGAAVAVLAGVTAAHWRAVGAVLGPLDQVADLGSPGAALQAVAAASPLGLLPAGLAAGLVVVALFGWASWAGAAGPRLVATAIAVAAAICWWPRAAGDWGWLVAALLPVGLAFAPGALRGLLRAGARRRRRITVTRVVR